MRKSNIADSTVSIEVIFDGIAQGAMLAMRYISEEIKHLVD